MLAQVANQAGAGAFVETIDTDGMRKCRHFARAHALHICLLEHHECGFAPLMPLEE
jgi:hypothetical protein